jgi:hypothetical protein
MPINTPGQVVGQGVSDQSIARLRERNLANKQAGLTQFQEGMATRRTAMEGQNRIQLQAMQNVAQEGQTAQLLAARELDRKLEEKLTQVRISADERRQQLDQEFQTNLEERRSEDMKATVQKMIDFQREGLGFTIEDSKARMKVMEGLLNKVTETMDSRVKRNISYMKAREQDEANQRNYQVYREETKARLRGALQNSNTENLWGVVGSCFNGTLAPYGIKTEDLTYERLSSLILQNKMPREAIDQILQMVPAAIEELTGETDIPFYQDVTAQDMATDKTLRKMVEASGGIGPYNQARQKLASRVWGTAKEEVYYRLQKIRTDLVALSQSKDDVVRKFMEEPYSSSYGGHPGALIRGADESGVNPENVWSGVNFESYYDFLTRYNDFLMGKGL